MPLRKLLDEISVIPGVTGSCIFDRYEGPLCADSQAAIATDSMIKVGSFLVRMLKMGKMNGLEITTSHYRFDNCTVVSTPLGLDSILLTICDTRANCSLVATTAAMLAADLEEQLQRDATSAPITADQDFSGLAEAEEPPPIEELQVYFDTLEELLAEAIGPVAGMILQDHIVSWQKTGPAVATRLASLVEMLLEEINEQALAVEFKTKAMRLL